MWRRSYCADHQTIGPGGCRRNRTGSRAESGSNARAADATSASAGADPDADTGTDSNSCACTSIAGAKLDVRWLDD